MSWLLPFFVCLLLGHAVGFIYKAWPKFGEVFMSVLIPLILVSTLIGVSICCDGSGSGYSTPWWSFIINVIGYLGGGAFGSVKGNAYHLKYGVE